MFGLPADQTKTPMIMVGPGTGVVPFIGFMQDRQVDLASGLSRAPAYLFFGCRRSDVDFIYKSDIAAWAETPVLTRSFLAFSREPNQKKVYVQDVMREQIDFLREQFT